METITVKNNILERELSVLEADSLLVFLKVGVLLHSQSLLQINLSKKGGELNEGKLCAG